MSAANPQAVRRNVAHTIGASSSVQRPAARTSMQRIGFAPKESDADAGFKINLSDLDIPRPQDQLEVEGFKPSLLSRILDLFSR